MRHHRIVALLGVLLAAAAAAWAQIPAEPAPRIEKSVVANRPVSGSFADEWKTVVGQGEKAQWIGYAVPQVAGNRILCCGNYDVNRGGIRGACGNCRLEGRDGGTNMTTSDESVKLEGPRRIFVLLRAEHKRIGKIRVLSSECTLDAGGLPFVWLTGVKPEESVAQLKEYVRGKDLEDDDEDLGNGALTAIALHADPSADRALESFVVPSEPEGLRKQAAFWLGEARGKAGLVVLQRMAKSDPGTEVRAQVAFALHVSREPEALNEMIRMARNDESGHVRGQALFWLAQKAGQKAVGTITAAIENDPDTDVKNKAVFALSQLPNEEGVPKLIEVARSNRNREVRKQAMFWLGESNDPRALTFFEEILAR